MLKVLMFLLEAGIVGILVYGIVRISRAVKSIRKEIDAEEKKFDEHVEYLDKKNEEAKQSKKEVDSKIDEAYEKVKNLKNKK